MINSITAINKSASGNIDLSGTKGMDYLSVKAAAMILRAVNQKDRKNMLKLIEDKASVNVSDIYIKLRMEQSVASQHLSILRKANVVTTTRKGKEIFYSLNYDRMIDVIAFVYGLTSITNSDNSALD
jgi:DNA-binding transcriptional ArsR family regulator